MMTPSLSSSLGWAVAALAHLGRGSGAVAKSAGSVRADETEWPASICRSAGQYLIGRTGQ